MTVTTDTTQSASSDSSGDDAVPGTWRGVLAPLGVFASSRDRRLLSRPKEGVPRTRPLPLPLLYQDALAPGHEGGVPVGVIDKAWIEGDFLMGEGRFDMADERAADVARKVHQNWLRFVSVDLDDDSHEIGCIGDNRMLVDCASYAASDDPEELPSHQGIVFSDWRLMGATLVSQPAFPEAFLASYTETADVEASPLTDTSSLTAGASDFAIGSLPFADRGRSWDAAAARKRIAKWASSDRSGDKETIDWSKYGSAFLVKGSEGDFGGYKFPVADVIDGALKLVWSAIVAAASVAQGGRGGTDESTGPIKQQLATLYDRARKQFKDPSIKAPWENKTKTAASLVRSHTTELAIGQFAPDNWRPADPWFNRPPFDEGTPWTVAGDRVFGHLALWNVCHIGIDQRCVMAPPSQSGYAYYATRLLETKGGVREVGIITMDTGHASLEAGMAPATAHYDNTGAMAAAVAIGEDEFGIWCAGSLLPTLTDEQRLRIQLAALSGDWRQVRGGMEMVACLAVNTPGFPQTRARSGANASPYAAVGCGALEQQPEQREARAEHVFGLERQVRVQLAAKRITASRIASMQKRMSALGPAMEALGAAATEASQAFEGIREGEPHPGGDPDPNDPDHPYHQELATFMIAALEVPEIRDACEPTDEEMARYDGVAEIEALARKNRKGNGKNWIEKTTTGHLPNFIRRVADHLMAKGMTESHAIAVAVNVVKKWCRGGADGNPADGLNWPKTQRVTPKTRAQGCADVAHWETKRAETKTKGAEETEALALAGVSS